MEECFDPFLCACGQPATEIIEGLLVLPDSLEYIPLDVELCDVCYQGALDASARELAASGLRFVNRPVDAGGGAAWARV